MFYTNVVIHCFSALTEEQQTRVVALSRARFDLQSEPTVIEESLTFTIESKEDSATITLLELEGYIATLARLYPRLWLSVSLRH